MFDLPDAKRVRRSDLYTRSQSASPTPSDLDPELEVQIRARLESIYGPPSNPASAPTLISCGEPAGINDDVEGVVDEPEQEFEFRLFSSTAGGKSSDGVEGPAQKIRLRDEEYELGEGGFVVRERNRAYYFAEKADGETEAGFLVMALSGEEILSRAKKRAWGLEVPWRVQDLKVSGKRADRQAVESVVSVEDDGGKKKKRPGKKRRKVLRERKKYREQIKQQQAVEKGMKEEAEREKRTRRNREKKVKRKMKEKAKKAIGGVEDGANDQEALKDPNVVTTVVQFSDQ